MIALALAVVRERDGIELPGGSVLASVFIHRRAYADAPVREAADRQVRRQVADHATGAGIALDPDDVTVAAVSPEELTDEWRTTAPADVPPLDNAYVLIGYWIPA